MLVHAREVGFRYDREWVVHDLDLKVDPGEFIAVVGPNGSGKSTMLLLLARVLTPERGEITLLGRPLSSYSRRDISQKMALIFQEGHGSFPFAVMDIVLMGRAPYMRGFAFESSGDREKANWAMEVTGVYPLKKRRIGELSGGERQRVFIARALAQETPIVLLDEATTHLDIHHQIAIIDILYSLKEEFGKTIVAVTHDLNLAASVFDRVILFSSGSVFSDGAPERVITAENIKKIYGVMALIDRDPAHGRPRVFFEGKRHKARNVE